MSVCRQLTGWDKFKGALSNLLLFKQLHTCRFPYVLCEFVGTQTLNTDEEVSLEDFVFCSFYKVDSVLFFLQNDNFPSWVLMKSKCSPFTCKGFIYFERTENSNKDVLLLLCNSYCWTLFVGHWRTDRKQSRLDPVFTEPCNTGRTALQG